MNANDNGHSGRTTIVHRMSADALGMRIAIDEASALRVITFLFAAIGEVAATGELDTSGAYVLAGGRTAYCGESGQSHGAPLHHLLHWGCLQDYKKECHANDCGCGFF